MEVFALEGKVGVFIRDGCGFDGPSLCFFLLSWLRLLCLLPCVALCGGGAAAIR